MGTEILLLCKETDFCRFAVKILRSYYDKSATKIISGDGDGRLNDELYWLKPRYVISFLSPWIVSEALLQSAQKAAINFHHGSPRYPGSGCYNFAIYEKAKQYGVTCHHMNKAVDTGGIIMTSYFDVSPNETIESLKLKSMNHLLFIFEKVAGEIYNNDSLPVSNEKWLRRPYTKRELDDLCKINPSVMSEEEINLRIRATDYCSRFKGAYIDLGGNRFYSESLVDTPLV